MDNRREVLARIAESGEEFSLKTIELWRKETKVDFWWTLFYVLGAVFLTMPTPANLSGSFGITVAHTLLFRTVQVILVLGWVKWGYRYGFMGYLAGTLVYLGFSKRLMEYQLQYEAVVLKRPSLYRIFFDDLQKYEDQVREDVRHYSRALELWVREEKWSIAGEKLTVRLEVLLREANFLSKEERSKIFERWEGILNPKRKKEYLLRLESELLHLYHQKRGFIAFRPPSGKLSSEDMSTEPGPREEVYNASKVALAESRRLIQEANRESDRQRKLRLYAQALEVNKKASLNVSLGVKGQVDSGGERKGAEIQFISLQDLARERFNLDFYLPKQVDALMSREILLALLAPGQSGRRFTANYRAEDTLRVRVRRQFEVHLGKQFDPKKFRDTLSWLVNEEVLFTKPKTDEKVYSLTSKTSGKSVEAQAVIRAMLAFDRSLKSN